MVRLLVVEDNAAVRMVLRFWFTNLGWEVVQATNGQEGRDLFLGDPGITVIISDLNMPLMDGLKFYEAISAELRDRQTVFVWHTTPEERKDVARLEATGRRVFPKPGDLPIMQAYLEHEVGLREGLPSSAGGLYPSTGVLVESG